MFKLSFHSVQIALCGNKLSNKLKFKLFLRTIDFYKEENPVIVRIKHAKEGIYQSVYADVLGRFNVSDEVPPCLRLSNYT